MKMIGLVALLVAAVLLLGLWPRDYVACPDWDIYVVDQDGKAMPGVAMNIAAMDPTVEDGYATVDRTTDAQGHVFVPRRVVRASRLRSIWGVLKQIPLLAHGEVNANGFAAIPPPAGYGYANPREPGEGGVYWYKESGHVVSREILYRCVPGVRRYGCDPNTKPQPQPLAVP
jgi:hypothetical protein